MAFQSLKNFTRTLTSLVNRNQRKLVVQPRLGPDAVWFNQGECEAYLEEMDTSKTKAATKVHVLVDWRLPS